MNESFQGKLTQQSIYTKQQHGIVKSFPRKNFCSPVYKQRARFRKKQDGKLFHSKSKIAKWILLDFSALPPSGQTYTVEFLQEF